MAKKNSKHTHATARNAGVLQLKSNKMASSPRDNGLNTKPKKKKKK